MPEPPLRVVDHVVDMLETQVIEPTELVPPELPMDP